MDAKVLESYKQRLVDMFAELAATESGSAEAAATVVLDQSSVGRLSRMDAMQAQQMAMATQRRRKQQMGQIKAALKRMEDGDFGFCLNCDEEIPTGRLTINPAIALCVKCAA